MNEQIQISEPWTPPIFLYLAFASALAALFGSLYFSEVANFLPCFLCWYQRICIYPLAAIFTVGIVRKDPSVRFYAWPLIIIGWCIALFHNLLYYHIISEAAAPCRAGISCTTQFIKLFGFLDIPMLSLLGFTAIGVFLFLAFRKK